MLDTLLQQRTELEQQIADEVARIDAASAPTACSSNGCKCGRARTTHCRTDRLVWLPWMVDEAGTAQPAFRA